MPECDDRIMAVTQAIPAKSGGTIAYEPKVPHCVRDDTVFRIDAVHRPQQNCHPERSEGPFTFLDALIAPAIEIARDRRPVSRRPRP